MPNAALAGELPSRAGWLQWSPSRVARSPALPQPCLGGVKMRGGSMFWLQLGVPQAHHLGPVPLSRTQNASNIQVWEISATSPS